MTESLRDGITSERLVGWAERLKEEFATPFLLIGVGHGAKSGQWTVCVPENAQDEAIIAALESLLKRLKGRRGPLGKRTVL